MALQEIFDSAEQIPEGLREHYIEVEGKYVLENIHGLKKAKEEIHDKYKKLQEKAKNFEGVDPEEVQRLREEKVRAEKERQEREKREAQESGNFQKLIEAHGNEMQGLKAAHTMEVQQLMKQNEELKSAMEQALVHNRLKSALQEHLVTRDLADLLVPKLAPFLQVVQVDGVYTSRYINPEDQSLKYVNGQGQLYSDDDFVKELKEKNAFKPLFKSTSSHGSGASPSNGGAFGGITSKKQLVTRQDKVDYIDKYGQAQYDKLPG